MDQVHQTVSNMPEGIALPRENGELVFASPWEASAFGLAVALHEQGAFEWSLFSQTLAQEIAVAEKAGEDSTYYESWLRALHRITKEKSLLTSQEVSDRSQTVKAHSNHEHDHDHRHDHHD